MRSRFPVFVLAGLFGVSLAGSAFAQTAKPASDDEGAIRKESRAYSDAYNKLNLEAAGQFWAPDAEYISDEGKVTKGRDAIVSLFKKGRVANKGYSFNVNVQSVRMIRPDVALEDGTVTLAAPDGTAEKTRYSAVLVKSDGKWLMTRVHDTGSVADSDQVTPYTQLKQLEWLVGQWEDQDAKARIQVTCRWAPGKSFLVQEYAIKKPNEDPLVITQRIGWDPINERMRSWIFDSNGGFSEGIWQRNGNQWEVAVTGVLPDGRRASARQVWSFVDDRHFKWQALDREIDSHPMADTLVTFQRAASAETAAAQPSSR